MFRKRSLIVLAVTMAIVTLGAFAHSAMSYISVARLPAFYTSQVQFDSVRGGHIGGRVVTFKCAGTLLVGDVAYVTTSNTVNKSATIALYNTIAGVTVGGTWKGYQGAVDSLNVGDTACVAGGRAILLKQGRMFVHNDAAGGLLPGSLILPSTTTAGYVKASPTSIDTFFRTVGRVVDTAATSAIITAEINIH